MSAPQNELETQIRELTTKPGVLPESLALINAALSVQTGQSTLAEALDAIAVNEAFRVS